MKELYANHMLTVPAGDNVVRILPPLTATDEEIAIALEDIEKAAESLSGGDRA